MQSYIKKVRFHNLTFFVYVCRSEKYKQLKPDERMLSKRAIIIITIIYTILITTLSVVNISSGVESIKIDNLDKIVHFCFYFGLNFLALSALFVQYGESVSISRQEVATAFIILYSVAIEVVQQFVGRSFDLDDIISNSIGAIVALLLFQMPSVKRLLLRYFVH